MNGREIGSKSLVIRRVRARQALLFEREHQIRPHDRHLDALFEKIYFHEIDGRDKVGQRLQLPLVAFLAIAGFVGTMLQNVNRADVSNSAMIFWLFLGCAICAMGGAAWFFIRSIMGEKYHFLPVPEDWSKHLVECIELYKNYDYSEELVSAALTKHVSSVYRSCGTVNGAHNARKSYYVFALFRWLVVAALCTVFAFAIFSGQNSIKITIELFNVLKL